MNWELITQGLELSVAGILTTFLSLGLFIGTILLLRVVFPAELRKAKPAAPEESQAVNAEDAVDPDAVAAAISAAVYVQGMLAAVPDDGTLAVMETSFVPRQQRAARRGLGARLEESRGRWWQPMSSDQD